MEPLTANRPANRLRRQKNFSSHTQTYFFYFFLFSMIYRLSRRLATDSGSTVELEGLPQQGANPYSEDANRPYYHHPSRFVDLSCT
jgi:hypothetical protein